MSVRRSSNRGKGGNKSASKRTTRLSSAISSDDPDAIKKLKIDLARREERQKQMKAVNKIIKAKKPATKSEKIELLMEKPYNFSEAGAHKLFQEDFAGRIGFPSYELTNNNAQIKRIKQRIIKLEAQRSHTTKTTIVKGVKIVDNVEANRLQLIFEGKPDAETRTKLKRAGFKWSPTNGAWQRFRSNQANYQANKIVNAL